MVPAAQRPLLEPHDRAELRAWLAENHATSSGVRLAIGKKGNPVSALSYDDAVEEALCFGWIDSTARKLDEHRYTIQFTPRKPRSDWSPSNKQRVARLIEQGRMAPSGLEVIEAAKRDGSWSFLDDVDAGIVPPDLQSALDAVPDAARHFSAMRPSLQQAALYWIKTAKRPETRARRIAATVRSAQQDEPPRSWWG